MNINLPNALVRSLCDFLQIEKPYIRLFIKLSAEHRATYDLSRKEIDIVLSREFVEDYLKVCRKLLENAQKLEECCRECRLLVLCPRDVFEIKKSVAEILRVVILPVLTHFLAQLGMYNTIDVVRSEVVNVISTAYNLVSGELRKFFEKTLLECEQNITSKLKYTIDEFSNYVSDFARMCVKKSKIPERYLTWIPTVGDYISVAYGIAYGEVHNEEYPVELSTELMVLTACPTDYIYVLVEQYLRQLGALLAIGLWAAAVTFSPYVDEIFEVFHRYKLVRETVLRQVKERLEQARSRCIELE